MADVSVKQQVDTLVKPVRMSKRQRAVYKLQNAGNTMQKCMMELDK